MYFVTLLVFLPRVCGEEMRAPFRTDAKINPFDHEQRAPVSAPLPAKIQVGPPDVPAQPRQISGQEED